MPRIEHYHRQDAGWHYEVVEAGGCVTLDERLELAIDDLYDGAFELPGD